jgi:hypothetical protein
MASNTVGVPPPAARTVNVARAEGTSECTVIGRSSRGQRTRVPPHQTCRVAERLRSIPAIAAGGAFATAGLLVWATGIGRFLTTLALVGLLTVPALYAGAVFAMIVGSYTESHRDSGWLPYFFDRAPDVPMVPRWHIAPETDRELEYTAEPAPVISTVDVGPRL